MDLEHHRKDAKSLLRAFAAGDPEAVARAREALGARVAQRFVLSDAQHVVAVEHGYRTWPELRHALDRAERERPSSRIGLQPVSYYEQRAARLSAEAGAGEHEARLRIQAHVPRLSEFAGGQLDDRDARLVIAREYGFGTWLELRRTVERVRAEHEGQREGSPEVRKALAAIEHGDAERLEQLLGAHPQLAGSCHNGAWTTLLEALAQPDVVGERLGRELGVSRPVAELLISRSEQLGSALNLAACFDRAELVELLLEAGADPAPSAMLGLTPLETALYHGARAAAELLAQRAVSPLCLWSAAALGRIELMERMLDAGGKLLAPAAAHRPNLADVGWPPGAPHRDNRQDIIDEAMCHAAHNGRDDAVAWLLDRGADVNGRPYLDLTALHFAVQFGHVSTVRLLLHRGADTRIRDRIHGGTPLQWAEHAGHTEITWLLDQTRRQTDVLTSLEYRPGDAVLVRVTRRERRISVADDGAALAKAGRPDGWREVARALERRLDVNVTRSGVVWLPVVRVGPHLDRIVERIGEASLAFYEELLELSAVER